MRLALDARARVRPHSSFARVLSLLEESARRVGLDPQLWSGGPCDADVLWSAQLEAPPVQGPQLVLTLHDVNPLRPDGRALLLHLRREVRFRRQVRRAFERAWRLATDSEDARSSIFEYFPQTRGRVSVVPLYPGTDMSPGDESETKRTLATHEIEPGYVLFVGALRRHKNWQALLKAFARLPHSLRRAHPLLFVGDPRRARGELERLSTKFCVESEVRVLGVVPPGLLPDLYRGASVFVFPSYMEGFGLPPLEAMACGTPVLASDRTSLPEVLGTAPRYIDPDRPDRIALELEAVLTRAPLREALRQAGLRQAASYGPQRTGQAMRLLLENR